MANGLLMKFGIKQNLGTPSHQKQERLAFPRNIYSSNINNVSQHICFMSFGEVLHTLLLDLQEFVLIDLQETDLSAIATSDSR